MLRRVAAPVETSAPAGATNAYVLGDDDAVLIDPAAWTADLRRAAIDADVAHVAVTHHHHDHVGAVRRAADELDATVWVRYGREESFAAAAGRGSDRTFLPGDELPAAGGVTVLDAPGHAPEHVAFATDDGLVVGDLAVAEGSVAVAAPEGDVRAYLASLRRVCASAPRTLYPGHGPPIAYPRATCRRLIGHRMDRERRVAAAVDAGAVTPDDVVDAAYEKDVSEVRDLARATVVAHLEKLSVEGRVRWDGERARPSP